VNTRLLLFGLLLVLLTGDVVTTTHALQEAGCREGNPVAAVFVGSPILHLLIKLSFAGVVLLLARQADRMVPRSGTCCVVAAVWLYMIVVTNNLLQIVAG
jgi:hypothetical protein